MAMNAEAPAVADVAMLRKQFTAYTGAKSAEITEQRQARHYYHGDQWTADELRQLKLRKQPPVFWNRVARKIDGVVGLLERLRQDPKAYPRTPKQAEGADLSTAVLRYVFDASDWQPKSSEASRNSATEGIGGLALALIAGDHGDPDLDFEPVDNDTFFYDPRSFRLDFSDARYMGTYKWVDEEAAKRMFPGKEEMVASLVSSGGEFDTEASRDRAMKWVNTDAKQLRLVEHWYQKDGQWRWCFWSADTLLLEGESPFYDEKGKTICRFIMFSAAVDHDGDRYGFVRNLKPAQDEINHRRSKSLYETLGRRLIVAKGSLEDVEKTRQEAVRPDGVVEYNPVGDTPPQFDDAKSDAQFRAQIELMAEAKAEIDNFSFNPSLVGTGVKDMSGRAISLQQQAGIAELGPFMVAYRGWKLRMYRAVWAAVQRHWSGERFIRVTDDEGLAQFIQVNGVGIDQRTGQPALVNALGSLDVDIILDESPDQINMQADAFEALTSMGPMVAERFPEIIIELAPVEERIKKQMRDKMKAMAEPDPAAQQAQQLQLAELAAKVKNLESQAAKNMAQAHQAMQPDLPQGRQPEGPRPPSVSASYADMPPEAKAQVLREAGIYATPDMIVAHDRQQARLRAAERSASRPQPQAA